MKREGQRPVKLVSVLITKALIGVTRYRIADPTLPRYGTDFIDTADRN